MGRRANPPGKERTAAQRKRDAINSKNYLERKRQNTRITRSGAASASTLPPALPPALPATLPQRPPSSSSASSHHEDTHIHTPTSSPRKTQEAPDRHGNTPVTPGLTARMLRVEIKTPSQPSRGRTHVAAAETPSRVARFKSSPSPSKQLMREIAVASPSTSAFDTLAYRDGSPASNAEESIYNPSLRSETASDYHPDDVSDHRPKTPSPSQPPAFLVARHHHTRAYRQRHQDLERDGSLSVTSTDDDREQDEEDEEKEEETTGLPSRRPSTRRSKKPAKLSTHPPKESKIAEWASMAQQLVMHNLTSKCTCRRMYLYSFRRRYRILQRLLVVRRRQGTTENSSQPIHRRVSLAACGDWELTDWMTDPEPIPFTPPIYSLGEISRYWQSLPLSQDPTASDGSTTLPTPFETSHILSPKHQDHIKGVGLWERLLVGSSSLDGGPSLSLARTEEEYLRSETARDLRIESTYDVDSFLAHVATPAVLKDGLLLTPNPPYLSAPKGKIRLGSTDHNRQKHMRLGWSPLSLGFGYEMRIFFPHLLRRKGKSSHLTRDQWRIWIADIIIPSIEVSCPAHVKHHYPRSFNDIVTKAQAPREKHPFGQSGEIDLRYLIPEGYLAGFWDAVLQRTTGDAATAPQEFRNPYLVLMAHDLKLSRSRKTAVAARADFIAHLDLLFHYDERWFPPAYQWLDMGREDTPADDSTPGVTLIRKSVCLQAWADEFHCPHSSTPRTWIRHWPWALTKDGASTDVEPASSNALSQYGGLGYSKSYNVFKNHYSTPLKGYQPFDNPLFEALAYSDDLIREWHRVNNSSHADIHGRHTAILQSFLRTKHRLKAAFQAIGDQRTPKNIGVRQEYRINIQTFLNLPLEQLSALDNPHPVIPSSSSSDPSHRPYWILPTADTIGFAAGDIARWLLCAECLIGEVIKGPGAVLQEQQLLHGVTLSVVLRTLRLAVNGALPKKMADMWNTGVTRQPRGRKSVTEEDGDSPRHQSTALVGLGYGDCLDRRGMVWLPHGLFVWEPLPTVAVSQLTQLALCQNTFAARFRSGGIRQQLEGSDRIVSHFRDLLGATRAHPELPQRQMAEREAMSFAAEMVIQAFILDLFRHLAQRHHPTRGQISNRAYQEFVGRLRPDEASGLRGLTCKLLERLIGSTPLVSHVDTQFRGATGTARNGHRHFQEYYTSRWQDRVLGVFAWQPDPPNKSPPWIRLGFRRLLKRLSDIADFELGPSGPQALMQRLREKGPTHLWILPLYSSEVLSEVKKPSKNQAAATRARINRQSALERTKWVLPRLHFDHHTIVQEADMEDPSSAYLGSNRELVAEALTSPDLPILSTATAGSTVNGDGDTGIPTDPTIYGVNPTLARAATYQLQLEPEA